MNSTHAIDVLNAVLKLRDGESIGAVFREDVQQARNTLERMHVALTEILRGSEVTGRWLNRNGEGDQCDESDPGAVWVEYSEDEQREWLDTVTEIAKKALT